MARTPPGPPPPPVVQRVRLRYVKRGRLRFTSHRDFARAFERALRRADVPMAYSAGFTPHPKISYVNATPTGVASEAEYLEIGLATHVELEALRAAIDAALPPGLDVIEAVAAGPGSLADRIEASSWRVELPGVPVADAAAAVITFLAESSVTVERLTKDGRREIDARAAVVSATVVPATVVPAALVVHEVVVGPVDGTPDGPLAGGCGPVTVAHAILELVVRQATPAVRPDDVLAALRAVAGLALVAPPVAVRLAQGPLDSAGAVGDPLAVDRISVGTTP